MPASSFACAQRFYLKKKKEKKSMNEHTCAHEYNMRAMEGRREGECTSTGTQRDHGFIV